jgi:tetratricopeptide (TPR) repeat protein/MoaA/NifB/PqqE/SkfB family radical SAM enzyme
MERDKVNTDKILEKARACAEKKDYETCLHEITAAEKIFPVDLEILLFKAMVLRESGDNSGALDNLKKLDDISGKARWRILLEKGRNYQELGDLKAALNSYEAALKLNAEEGELFFELGRIYRESGLFPEAESSLENAERLGFQNNELNLEYAILFREKADYRKAIDQLEKIGSEHAPDRGRVHQEKGRDFQAMKDYANAAKEYGQAISEMPDNKELYLEMSRCYYHSGDPDRAAYTLMHLPSGIAKDASVLIMLAKILINLRRYAEARGPLDELAVLAGEDSCLTLASRKLEYVYEKGMKLFENYREYPITVRGGKASVPPYRVRMMWHITLECNYRCSYCVNTIKNGFINPRGYKVRRPEKWLDIWKRVYDKYGTCSVHITGGEPTVYPDFFKIAGLLSRIHLLEIDTNMSWEPSSLISEVSPVSVERIGASYQPEYVDVDAFFEKVSILKRAGYNITVQGVARPDIMDELYICAEKCRALKIPALIAAYNGSFGGDSYPGAYRAEELKKLEEIRAVSPKNSVPGFWQMILDEEASLEKCGYEEILPAESDTLPDMLSEACSSGSSGRRCRMGQMFLEITANGDLLRCIVSEEKFGNIWKKGIILEAEPRECSKTDCDYNMRMLVGEEEKWLNKWQHFRSMNELTFKI